MIANGHVRATRDIDLLVPSGAANDRACEHALQAMHARWADGRGLTEGETVDRPHSRVVTDAGLLDLIREGEPPLDYKTVAAGALTADLGSGPFPVAGLASMVAFKRLARRPQDRADLAELELIHGRLPAVHVPGLDD